MFASPRTALPALSAALLIALSSTALAAAPPPTKNPPAQVKPAAKTDALDPAAVDALKNMGAYLSGLTNIELKATYETEIALDNDQKVDIGGSADYLAKRPDRLRVQLDSDMGGRTYIYNGQSLIVASAKDKVYSQLDDVGSTIKDMLEGADTYAGIEIPLVEDLFKWGTIEDPGQLIKTGFLVGTATLNGQATKHWAFRTDNKKDVEIWITDGEAPLPVKIVIIDRSGKTLPRFEANLSWDTNPTIADTSFAFQPEPGQTEIPMLTRAPQEASK